MRVQYIATNGMMGFVRIKPPLKKLSPKALQDYVHKDLTARNIYFKRFMIL